MKKDSRERDQETHQVRSLLLASYIVMAWKYALDEDGEAIDMIRICRCLYLSA